MKNIVFYKTLPCLFVIFAYYNHRNVTMEQALSEKEVSENNK